MLLQIAALTAITLFIGISTSAGIGGATIVNLLLVQGFAYTTKESITLTYIFLMGGSLAAALVSARTLTPKGKRQLDYNLVLLTLPMLISGSIIGTIINHFISQKTITLVFLLVLLYLLKLTYNQTQEPLQPHKMSEEVTSIHRSLIDTRLDLNNTTKLTEILEQEQHLVPVDKLKIILQIYTYTVVLVLFRGGSGYQSIIGLEQCHIGSWMCVILHLILSYLFSKSIAIRQFQHDQQKENLGYFFEDPREKMSYQKMRECMFNGLFAGILGGSMAVSGAVILVPLWLRSGIDHDTVINSTAPLIFFGSSVSFLISVLFQLYDSFLMALLFFSISFLGTYFIKSKIFALIETLKLHRLQYTLLFFLMLLSFLTFIPVQFHKYKADQLQFEQFHSFC